EILLTVSLYGRSNKNSATHTTISSFRSRDNTRPVDEITPLSVTEGAKHSRMTSINNSICAGEDLDIVPGSHLAEGIKNNDSVNKSATLAVDKDASAEFTDATFEEAMEIMQLRDESEMPENLQGGILLEQTYTIEPKDLNSFLFGPNSKFMKDLAELQGTTDYQETPWTWKCMDPPCLTSAVSYTKAATKLVKAVKATEEQTYIKADGKRFAVMVRVSTPEVPFGNSFEVVLLYKIMPGPELLSGEESSHFVISFSIDFLQSTVMKSMIEGSARQGLKENFESFADTLSQHIKPATSSELEFDKDKLLAPLQLDHQSDLELAIKYFCNFTVVSTIVMVLYVLLHILLSQPATMKGLEFDGLDLPDTFGELITSAIIVLQVECVLDMISHFVQARMRRGCDHGVQARGVGWLLTVALVEGKSLPPVVSSGFSDPYVVFSCNEPPSVLDVEVFNFDGPFDLSTSLGHAEINFLKHASAELADIWVPLEGRLAQTCQSQLHLRIFLDNTRGVETIREYLAKMEKEVGKKLDIRSPHKNSAFQKLFGLPPEEFLINDYSCSLKRKIPLQGRLFLSARTVGFYANLFGHKTKFFFLWEDVEDIQVVPPSFATMGGPALLMTLKRGRGLDARHGAKSQDQEGRLRFQFQSFVSFNTASRTIMALWRMKNMVIDQRAKLEQDQQDDGKSYVSTDDAESIMNIDDVALSKAYSSELSVDLNSLMEIFNGGDLEMKIMSKVGCLNYSSTPWEDAKPNIQERRVRYKFNRYMSIFGSEVVSTQMKSPSIDGNGWTIDDVTTLHNVPFSDCFRVRLRYDIQSRITESWRSQCDVFVGIEWLRSTKFQQRITRNICDKLAHRAKEIFELAEREIPSAKATSSD
ncbi:C2 and GRAM domain-containing protein, partial [Ananas comosus]